MPRSRHKAWALLALTAAAVVSGERLSLGNSTAATGGAGGGGGGGSSTATTGSAAGSGGGGSGGGSVSSGGNSTFAIGGNSTFAIGGNATDPTVGNATATDTPRPLRRENFDGTRTVPITGAEFLLIYDMSGSFHNDMKNVRKNAPILFERLAEEYPGAKIGLSTFIDKPYDHYHVESSLGDKFDWSDYCYNTEVPLTTDYKKISDRLQTLDARGWSLHKKSQLDAMYYGLRSKEVGWSTDRSIMRIIILVTDTSFRYPGDAALRNKTFIPHPDDANGDDDCMTHDYVSEYQLKKAFEEVDAYPVVLAVNTVTYIYRNLTVWLERTAGVRDFDRTSETLVETALLGLWDVRNVIAPTTTTSTTGTTTPEPAVTIPPVSERYKTIMRMAIFMGSAIASVPVVVGLCFAFHVTATKLSAPSAPPIFAAVFEEAPMRPGAPLPFSEYIKDVYGPGGKDGLGVKEGEEGKDIEKGGNEGEAAETDPLLDPLLRGGGDPNQQLADGRLAIDGDDGLQLEMADAHLALDVDGNLQQQQPAETQLLADVDDTQQQPQPEPPDLSIDADNMQQQQPPEGHLALDVDNTQQPPQPEPPDDAQHLAIDVDDSMEQPPADPGEVV